MTVDAVSTESGSASASDDWTTVNGISNTSYTLSGLTAKTFYLVQVQAAKDEWTSDWKFTSFTTTETPGIVLANNADNSSVLTNNIGQTVNVTLADRTLYKDGSWNTLCLPFAVSDFTGTPLEGATVKTLKSSDFDNNSGKLTLNFGNSSDDNLTSIQAGTPYIVKWAEGEDIENPIFNNVTISDATAATSTPSYEYVDFIGTYSPVPIYEDGDEKHNLYLGSGNRIFYPHAAFTINSCRAYFKLKNGLTAGTPSSASGVRSFTLNFGDSEASGIMDAEANSSKATGRRDSGNPFTLHSSLKEGWYTLDGRRLNGKPTTRGIYVNNGRVINIK